MLLCSEINSEKLAKDTMEEPEETHDTVILPVIDTTTRPSSVNNQILTSSSLIIEELQVRQF